MTLDHEWRERLTDHYGAETEVNVQPSQEQDIRLSDQIIKFIAEKGLVSGQASIDMILAYWPCNGIRLYRNYYSNPSYSRPQWTIPSPCRTTSYRVYDFHNP